MSWVGDLLRAGIDAKGDTIKFSKPVAEVDLTISDADQGDGTTDVTLQVTDGAGNSLSDNFMLRVWTGGGDDFGVDALTGITASTGTIVDSTTANGDIDLVTDENGTAVLAMDNNGAGSIYVWVALQSHVYESGELTITSS